MKKRYLIAGMMVASLAACGQQSVRGNYVPRDLPASEVQTLYSFYTQDGNHSAVTGGQGTENLQVYSAQFAASFNKDSVRSWHLEGGSDLISSASTDRIDFVMSSASRNDFRVYGKVGYDKYIGPLTLGLTAAYSFESDYQSKGIGLHLDHISRDLSTEISFDLQMYFDDLRWYDQGRHEKLIYPIELRFNKWFDITNRNSYNFSLGIYRTLNKRMTLGLYPGISYQKGLLSTPFHRVYFTNDSERVENLPRERIKFPVGIQLNTFIDGRWILRTGYRFYLDNFGIYAHSIEIEAPVKINPRWTITPLLRVHAQTKADYFLPYGEHNPLETFYTSDYDLARLLTYKLGLGARYAPYKVKDNSTFRAIEWRYAFYGRDDGLAAHVITVLLDWSYEKSGGPN